MLSVVLRMIRCIAAALFVPAAALGGIDDHFVAAGRYFTFVVEAGEARAAGQNTYGQLGLGDEVNQDELQLVTIGNLDEDENKTVSSIAAGAFHSIFLMGNGEVYTAGRNNFGQLGRSGEPKQPVPTKVEFDLGVKKVAAGYAHSLFLMKNGSVRAAGLNQHGQLGLGRVGNQPVPKEVSFSLEAEEEVVDIAAGYDFSYFLTNKGVLYATGQNLGGQLGTGDKKTRFTPVRAKEDVMAMAAGESHGLLISLHESEEQWFLGTGANYRGQLGNGTNSKPVAAWAMNKDRNMQMAASLSAGGASSCFSRTAERVYVYCFGDDSSGQLGITGGEWDPSRDESMNEPSLVPYGDDGIDVVDGIALGDDHGIFVNHDEVLVAGSNEFGQLGNPDFDSGLTSLQRLLRFSNRGVRPTPAPSPPSPPPSPPSPPSPAPSPGRDTDSVDGLTWEVLIAIAAGILVFVLVLVGLGRISDDEAAADGEAEGEIAPPSLELVRTEVSKQQ